MEKNVYRHNLFQLTLPVITLLLLPSSFVDAYTFTRTLSVGDEGQDVLELQKILNSNSQTAVSVSNTRGSYGNETTYFGTLTKDAVIRFQNLHAEEILYSNGLTKGTGFVGKSTLAFLNKTQNNAQETVSSKNSETTPTNSTSNKNTSKSIIPEFLISKTKSKADKMLYVGSQHTLQDTAKFYLDGKEMWQRCQTEYTCKLHIDKDTKPGIHTITSNNDLWGSYEITILSSSEKTPDVDINSISLTKQNIIKGSNFSKTVKVYTMYGVYTSETKNNSFILSFPEDYAKNAKLTKGLFYIENENGLTSDVKNITYEI